jgi:hypothetical protein
MEPAFIGLMVEFAGRDRFDETFQETARAAAIAI